MRASDSTAKLLAPFQRVARPIGAMDLMIGVAY
jgi:hypothetical protein